jgi:integrase
MTENQLYNEEQKERYLHFISDNEGTHATIRNIFYKAFIYEEARDRDLCNFNLEEIGKVIKRSNPYNLNTAKSTLRFISGYISFCIENGLRDNNINPLDGVSDQWVDSFVDKTKKIHYSYTEFLELLDKIENMQDKIYLFLLFEGIQGEKFSELRNLKYEHIDKDNKTIFIEERNESIEVSDKCIEYLELAQKETEYMSYIPKSNTFNKKELLPSDYVFKNVKSPRTKEYTQVNMVVFYNRLAAIKEYTQKDFLTPVAIMQSGMIWEAVKLYNKEHALGYDQIAKIGKKYNYSTITNNGYTYYNSFLMKNFMTMENFSELYGLNIEITKR